MVVVVLNEVMVEYWTEVVTAYTVVAEVMVLVMVAVPVVPGRTRVAVQA